MVLLVLKMKKKVITSLLAVCTLAMFAAGCGKEETLEEKEVKEAIVSEIDKENNESEEANENKEKADESAEGEESDVESDTKTQVSVPGTGSVIDKTVQSAIDKMESKTEEAEEEKEAEIDYANTTFVAIDEVNIRAESNTDSDVIGCFTKGDRVYVTGEKKENDMRWYSITFTDADGYETSGFVSSDYVNQVHPLSDANQNTSANMQIGDAEDAE